MREESQDLQTLYTVFRVAVYVLLVVEVFEYAVTPAMLEPIGAWLVDVHDRIGRWSIYQAGHLPYSKLATIMMGVITCIGTKAKKQLEFNGKSMVFWPLVTGFVMVILSIWMYETSWLMIHIGLFTLNAWIYIVLSIVGVVAIQVGLDNVSKYIKNGVMKDRFNFENESFEQNEEFKETPYSVNIPMRYYYKGKFRHGWININNPFRGTFVIGTPGSGKSFSVIDPFIRQHSAKGFAMVVYDYKFPTLAEKLYWNYKKNKKLGKIPKGCKFNVINFVDVEYSRRVNPIQHKYISDLAAASETANTLVQSLQKGKADGGGGSDNFFQTSAVNFLAACIFFFVNYKRMPYDNETGEELVPEYHTDKETGHKKLTGNVFDKHGNPVPPNKFHWLGKYSDMPHVLAFLNLGYKTMFDVLETDNEVFPLIAPFKSALKGNAMEQLEGMIGTLRVQTSRLATKEAY